MPPMLLLLLLLLLLPFRTRLRPAEQLIIPRLGLERSITYGLLVYALSQVNAAPCCVGRCFVMSRLVLSLAAAVVLAP